jgi:hypothetical protein
MAEIIGTMTELMVGANTCYPVMTRPSCEIYEVPSLVGENAVRYRQFIADDAALAPRHDQHKRWDDYEVSNLVIDPNLKGAILAPTTATPQASMALANFTYEAGKVGLCAPYLDQTGAPLQYVYMYDGTPNQETTVTSTYLIGPSPTILFSFGRQPWPPEGQDVAGQYWDFAFGDFTLRWGRTTPPQLWRDGQLISQYPLTREDAGRYAGEPLMQWTIRNILGRLYISCNLLRETWVVGDIGDLDACYYSVAGNGGQFWFNLSPLTYETSGYLITDWIWLPFDFPDEDMMVAVYPYTDNAVVSVYESAPNARRYRVELSGDGATTPLLQSFWIGYAPTFAEVADSWKVITPWADDGTIQEELPLDWQARKLTFRLRPNMVVNGKTLWEFAGLLSGEVPFKYRVGVKYADGTDDSITRMYGVLSLRGDKMAIGATETLDMEAADRYVGASQIGLPHQVTCQGMNAGDAVAWLLQIAGIAPWDIVVDPAITAVLDDPQTDYTTPPWQFQPFAKIGDCISRILEAYHLRLYSGGDGKFHINAGRFSDVMIALDFDEGATTDTALSRVEATVDLKGITNFVYGKGVSPSGKPFFAAAYDYDSIFSPGTPRYVGKFLVDYRELSDCTSQASLQNAVDNIFAERSGGWPRWTLTSPTAPLCLLWPDTWATVKVGGVVKELLITNVSGKPGIVRNADYVITLEDRST